MAENPGQKASTDEDILALARDRFRFASEADMTHRAEALDDLEFLAGNQWPAQVRAARDKDKRPCLTINRLPSIVRQVENDQRQNRPSIKVHPVDDKADIDTAKIIQGMIRHIESNSSADMAYDNAFSGAARMGRGWFRIITQYRDDRSFDQEILIKRIRNHFMVYGDPGMKEPDGSDMNFAFVGEDHTVEEYKEAFPNSQVASAEDFKSLGDQFPLWIAEKTVRVVEYFYRDWKDVELVQYTNGAVFESDKLPLPELLPQGVTEKRRRTARVPVIKWIKTNGVEILEKTEWLGKWIPLIPVIGEEIDVNGKLILKGIVRDSKDPQRMLNYWASAETETIALSPKAPFIVAEGQLEGHEKSWETANERNHPYLQYKPTTIAGQLAPPPQRQQYEPAVQAITMARGQASEDLKAVSGIYDAALGARSNETSGVAIQKRAHQAQTSNFHLIDNLTRSLKHAGRILVDLIPKIYDTAGAARILGENGDQEIVKINEVFKDKAGQEKQYKLDLGCYDVTVDVGPSFATKRQEAAANMMELSKSVPAIGAVAPDLLVKSLDFDGATEIADRLKKTLPPGVVDDKDKAPIPPQVKAAMDQQGQLIEGLTAKLNEAQESLDRKREELESKERIAMAEIKAKIEIEMLKVGSTEALALLGHQMVEIQQRLSLIDQYARIGEDDLGGQGEPLPEMQPEQILESQPPEMGAPQDQFQEAGPEGGELPPENDPIGGEAPSQTLE